MVWASLPRHQRALAEEEKELQALVGEAEGEAEDEDEDEDEGEEGAKSF